MPDNWETESRELLSRAAPAPPPHNDTHKSTARVRNQGEVPTVSVLLSTGETSIPSLAGPHQWREVEITPRVSGKWQGQVRSRLEGLTWRVVGMSQLLTQKLKTNKVEWRVWTQIRKRPCSFHLAHWDACARNPETPHKKSNRCHRAVSLTLYF